MVWFGFMAMFKVIYLLLLNFILICSERKYYSKELFIVKKSQKEHNFRKMLNKESTFPKNTYETARTITVTLK